MRELRSVSTIAREYIKYETKVSESPTTIAEGVNINIHILFGVHIRAPPTALVTVSMSRASYYRCDVFHSTSLLSHGHQATG